MKKILLSFLFLAIGTFINAQSNFDKQIKETAIKVKAAKSISELNNLFAKCNTLMSESDAKNSWKSYYFAGLTQYRIAEISASENNIEQAKIANATANKYVSSALISGNGMQKNNAEIKKLLDLIKNQNQKLLK